jgi:hypothetical protein
MFAGLHASLDAGREEYRNEKLSELVKMREINDPIIERYSQDLEEYGVNLSPKEYERIFYFGEELVDRVDGKPQNLSVSFTDSGDSVYLVADGAVVAEVERAPVVNQDLEPITEAVDDSFGYSLTSIGGKERSGSSN